MKTAKAVFVLTLFAFVLCAPLPIWHLYSPHSLYQPHVEIHIYNAPAKVDTPNTDPAIRIATHLQSRYAVEESLAIQLAEKAQGSENGELVLAIMAVESEFNPRLKTGKCVGLGQINPVHIQAGEIRSAKNANRANIVDECGIVGTECLYDPAKNFCATNTIFTSLLERRGTVEKALYDYVGSRGNEGRAYVKKVMNKKAEFDGCKLGGCCK